MVRSYKISIEGSLLYKSVRLFPRIYTHCTCTCRREVVTVARGTAAGRMEAHMYVVLRYSTRNPTMNACERFTETLVSRTWNPITHSTAAFVSGEPCKCFKRLPASNELHTQWTERNALVMGARQYVEVNAKFDSASLLCEGQVVGFYTYFTGHL